MRHLFLSVLILAGISVTYGQSFANYKTKEEIKPLKRGEKVPDILFDQLVAFKSKNTSLSELYKNKILILDFWSTSCITCIKQFPRLKELQDQFGEKIAIVPVGFDNNSGKDIRNFLVKSKGTGRELKLPSILQDLNTTELTKLFPCDGVPFEVWIDSSGRFLGSTTHLAVTSDNISKLLEGESLDLGIERVARPLHPTESFLLTFNPDKPILYGSAFTNCADTLGMLADLPVFEANNYVRVINIDKTVIDYYSAAYVGLKKIPQSRSRSYIQIDSKGKLFYEDWPTKELSSTEFRAFKKNNLFCYDALFPPTTTRQEVYEKVVADLDQFFKIKSSIQKRNVECIVLQRIPGVKLVSSESNRVFTEDNDNNRMIMKGVSMDLFKSQISPSIKGRERDLPIVDETDWTGMVDIVLPSDLSFDDMKACVRKIGFDLTISRRDLDVLVLENIR